MDFDLVITSPVEGFALGQRVTDVDHKGRLLVESESCTVRVAPLPAAGPAPAEFMPPVTAQPEAGPAPVVYLEDATGEASGQPEARRRR